MNNIKSILAELRKMKSIALILLFVGLVLYSYQPLISEVVKKEIDNDPVKEDINNNIIIQQMLNNLMLKYGADRAYVFRFHNGIFYYDGSHKNHQSLAYEVCGSGISTEKQYLQNLPVSLYPNFLQQVMLNKMIYKDINDIKEETTKISLNEQGIKSVFVAPFFKEGKFVCYIGLDYVKSQYTDTFDYKEFRNLTDEIGYIITQI
jgi:hypothetical protein